MSDVKISALTSYTTPLSADVIPVVDTANTTTKKVSFTNLVAAIAAFLKTLTNTTFDTAGTGNVFKINGTSITDKTGTGKAVLDTSPTIATPTLTAPVISTITNTGTITLPTSTDTLVGKATTDTLTNKTLTDSTNNVMAKSLKSATTTVDVSAATAPTAGQVLKATDSTHATWQAAGGASNYQVFTANGTWTKPSSLTGDELVTIQAWGGGGGGGSMSSGQGGAGGGGGGDFIEYKVPASALTSTVSVTVGAASSPATVGNNTSFGSYVTAYGGGAGATGANTTTAGGGGAGLKTIGSDASGATGGAGGDPLGAAAGVSHSGFGGGGGGSTSAGSGSPGGYAVLGGGGGGGGSGAATNGAAGGASIYGGGGGGGGSLNATGGAGGTSTFGGAGGAGSGSNNNGTAGTAPGGGGGGSSRSTAGASTGGAGARGEVRVWVTTP